VVVIIPRHLFCSHLQNTHTQPFNGLWSGTTPVGRYQKKHSPTHTHPNHRTSFIIFSIYNYPWHPLCSVYELDSLLGQPLSRTSLVSLSALDPLLHTPCISSPNHHHLFAAHAHTNPACFAAIPMLCHLYLVSHICKSRNDFVWYFCLKPEFGVTSHTQTHTHTFNGTLSRTTRASQYQKGKTNLDFFILETFIVLSVSLLPCMYII